MKKKRKKANALSYSLLPLKKINFEFYKDVKQFEQKLNTIEHVVLNTETMTPNEGS